MAGSTPSDTRFGFISNECSKTIIMTLANEPGVISVALEPDQPNDGSQSGQLVRDQVLKLVGT
ncbi:hypothetical protein ABH973_005224 [Bradyrhizobium ottawaense]|jgi:hypothetical protein|nr:hypothetical protein TM102_50420 [Bradyrhizobium sp. TM102]